MNSIYQKINTMIDKNISKNYIKKNNNPIENLRFFSNLNIKNKKYNYYKNNYNKFKKYFKNVFNNDNDK